MGCEELGRLMGLNLDKVVDEIIYTFEQATGGNWAIGRHDVANLIEYIKHLRLENRDLEITTLMGMDRQYDENAAGAFHNRRILARRVGRVLGCTPQEVKELEDKACEDWPDDYVGMRDGAKLIREALKMAREGVPDGQRG